MTKKRGRNRSRLNSLEGKKVKKILNQKLPENKHIKPKKLKKIRKKIKKNKFDLNFIKSAPEKISIPEQNVKKKFSIKNLFGLRNSNKENSNVQEQNLIKKFKDFEDKQKDYIETDLDKLVNFVNQVEVIKISKEDNKNPKYYLVKLSIAQPTLALLDEIKNKLIEKINLNSEEILDQKIAEKLKEKFKELSYDYLKGYLQNISEDDRNYLIGTLIHESLGLGDIEFLLNDIYLEEIVISSAKEPVRVYHKKYGWLETNIIMRDEDQILNYSNAIARRIGKQITTLNPLLDAHLLTGDRVNAVLYPIATKGNTITMRKFNTDPITVTDMINIGVSPSNVFAMIWTGLEYEMNMLVSGGTASGKTTFLNVCMPFIPTNHRIISIEDTRELYLPKYLYWTPLVTRPPNPEGKGEITMLDLLVNSLRMRPDRIILGEIRRKEEAEILLEQVHLNVVMFRDRRRGIRRTYQVSEFVQTGEEGTSIKPNILYRWNAASDKIVEHLPSVKLFEQLSRYTGLSKSELDKDILLRKKILEWMVKKNVRDVQNVGKIISEYYLDRDAVLSVVNKNQDSKKLLE